MGPRVFLQKTWRETVTTPDLKLQTPYSRDSQRIDGVDWIPFIAYGNLAEIAAKYLDKGSHVSVDGRLKPWRSTKDDTPRYGMDVVATDILFLDPKDQAASPEEVRDIPGRGEVIEPDEIPF